MDNAVFFTGIVYSQLPTVNPLICSKSRGGKPPLLKFALALPEKRSGKLRKYVVVWTARIFDTEQAGKLQKYFVYFKDFSVRLWGKRTADPQT